MISFVKEITVCVDLQVVVWQERAELHDADIMA